MSRIGKSPITVPAGVTVSVDEATNVVTVKGPKIKVELNGAVILDADLSTVKEIMA